MPTINTKPMRFDPKGEAIRREKMRNADLDREERNKKFPTIFVKGYGFRPYYSGHDTIHIKGPLCPGFLSKNNRCLAPLKEDSDQSTQAQCPVCDKKFNLPYGFKDFRGIADYAYEGMLNSEAKIITLDVPFEAVKAENQDDTRWVKVLWSQKDGRNQAVIYFIDKEENGDKTQIFADMDREEIRYDASDIKPGKILAKIKAEFRKTKIEVEYKE